MDSNIEIAKKALKEALDAHKLLANSAPIAKSIQDVSVAIIEAFEKDKKVLFCGNGGSAADAQHLAAEFSGKFYVDRDPLFAEALHVNTSYLTAVANDYSYDDVFSRLVKAKGREGDVLVGISTSGNSGNVIAALEMAKKQKMITVGFTGESPRKMGQLCDYVLNVPATTTPRIQELHILVGHTICEIVEKCLFPSA